ncbi:MAG: hypothetical protein DRP97_06380 [Candidatus Latescibacterota bacterium]|nr:MAG: hypothetical protein DRP97_06380 [Candidatus Latescibacterota bacterium]
MKITRIGAITLDYGLWWKEFDSATAIIAETEKTIDGSLIIFEQPNRTSSQFITAESRDDGWQSKAIKEALISLADGSMGIDIEIELSNNSTIDVRFAYETDGGAVQFEPLFDGADWYIGTVYMSKV